MQDFQDIPQLLEDPIFSLPILYAQDPRPNKVNLGIGVYQDDQGRHTPFSCVRKAETLLLEQHLDKNYQPIDGNAEFIKETTHLIFGDTHAACQKDRVFTIQTVGGVCALRLGAEFLHTLIGKKIYLSDPTWANHKNIFKRAGMDVHSYPYLEPAGHSLDFDSLKNAILKMSSGSIILMQVCSHNPTGIDLEQAQWKELSVLIQKQNVIPFFDLAYQGFAEGIEEDVWAIRHFAQEGHTLLAAYSYSKNMGLYGERVGALSVITSTADSTRRVASQFRQMVRGIYSTPPLQGGRIAAMVLSRKDLKEEWENELQTIRCRLHRNRQQLVRELQEHSGGTDYAHIGKQKGMFSSCGLTPHQVQRLIQHYAIYLPTDGRINVAGLNPANMEYVSQAILEVMSL